MQPRPPIAQQDEAYGCETGAKFGQMHHHFTYPNLKALPPSLRPPANTTNNTYSSSPSPSSSKLNPKLPRFFFLARNIHIASTSNYATRLESKQPQPQQQGILNLAPRSDDGKSSVV